MNRILKAGLATALSGFVLCAALQPAEAAVFSGQWSVSGTIGTVSKASPVCTFAQSGTSIRGTCRGPNAAGPAAGAVTGSRIIWQWRANATNSIGTSGLITYRGTLGSDNVIRGSWTFSAVPGGVGTFTAIRPY